MVKMLLGPAAAVGGALAISFFCFSILHSNATIAALFLLLGVVLAGVFASRAVAVAGSVAATLCLDYFFIPPIGRISIGDPEGWLALAVFLAVSLIATNLSARLRRQRDEIIEQQAESEKLHALNRAILLRDGVSQDLERILVNKCMELFGFEEAAIFQSATGSIYRSQPDGRIGEAELRRVAHYGSAMTNERMTVVPVALGNKIYGSFGFVGQPIAVGLFNSLGNTIAVSLAQAETQQAANRAEAVRRSEELKSLMIDALAHELKTPLTSIEAAADMLHGGSLSADQSAELIDIVQQEAKRLQQLMEEALHLARIEAKRLKLTRKAAPVRELIEKAIAALGPRAGAHPIEVEAGSEISVSADSELIVELVKQLLDNALKYGATGKPISVSADEENGLVHIRVRDEGPGLTELEQATFSISFTEPSVTTMGCREREWVWRLRAKLPRLTEERCGWRVNWGKDRSLR